MSRRINRPEQDDVTSQYEDVQQYVHDDNEQHLDEQLTKAKRPRVRKKVETQMPEMNTSADANDNIEELDVSTPNEQTKQEQASLLSSLLKTVKRNTKNPKLKAKITQTQAWEEIRGVDLILHSFTIYTILFLLILANAIGVVHQTFKYRKEYQQLNELKQQTHKLDIEWGRMLIEKQTFGASGQIATRATMQMSMFSPAYQQRIVIHIPQNNKEDNRHE
ncbi:cell division protein FtsL [Moraxella sp. ZY21109]|uniref:cell division protein FtsL n=1 Tax=Moraxella sp. ZY21109 TaxID=2911969 RepID=UPI003D7E1B1E